MRVWYGEVRECGSAEHVLGWANGRINAAQYLHVAFEIPPHVGEPGMADAQLPTKTTRAGVAHFLVLQRGTQQQCAGRSLPSPACAKERSNNNNYCYYYYCIYRLPLLVML